MTQGHLNIDETLFIGDSNTARMVQYGPVTLANSLGASSMGIQHVLSTPCINFSGYSSPVYVAKAVEMMQPRRIVINYGTNNTSWDVETFIKQYKAALDAIHKSYEYADIIIASVLPVAKERTYPTITMQKIDAFNKALVELAKQEGYQYLNSTEAIADANTGYARADYMMSDGIHLNGEGMAAYFNYVRTHSYTTEDRRPTLKKVPAHLATPDSFFGPEVPAPESESDSSSTTNSKYSFTLAGADIQIGQTVQLNAAEYKPSAAEFLEKQGTTVTWTSSDTTIATVSGGAVTGVKAGTVEITCTIGKISKKCKVTVKDVPLQLTIGGNLTVVVGTTSQLSVSFSPATYAGAKVATWSSSNTAAATIDPSTGLVKAIAEGKTEIVVSMDGKSTTKTTLTVTAAAHTHAWTEWKVDPAPTCSTEGKKTRTCACGASETMPVPATGAHQWTIEVAGSRVEPTCSANGTHKLECNVCHQTKDEVLPATGNHTKVEQSRTEPQVGVAGNSHWKCSVCQQEGDDVIPALPEPPASSVVPTP